jgi:hypothetical protein
VVPSELQATHLACYGVVTLIDPPTDASAYPMTLHIVRSHMCATRLRTILLAGQKVSVLMATPECMRIHSQLTLGAGPIDQCHVMTRVNEKCIDLHQLLPSMILYELTKRIHGILLCACWIFIGEHGNALQFPNTLPHYFTFGKSSNSSPKVIPATHSRYSGHAKQANVAID